ncbi:hypothetical protein [Mesorhizobium sp. 1M-11]|uniref:hypothetical protein n=1 Tax=Mesorhizobium sp. 1M-11 TaxID=1529006 RepID=UPI0006C7706D|nr:hypothetical protein [Mesorhizobium sp. 1M-11]
MACDCITRTNEKLASRNTRLVSTLVFTKPGGEYPLIRTEQVESGRGKAKACAMLPSYCPFCGVKYKAEE